MMVIPEETLMVKLQVPIKRKNDRKTITQILPRQNIFRSFLLDMKDISAWWLYMELINVFWYEKYPSDITIRMIQLC